MMESYEEMIWTYEDDVVVGNRNHRLRVIMDEGDEQDQRERKKILVLQGGFLFILFTVIAQCYNTARKNTHFGLKARNKIHNKYYYDKQINTTDIHTSFLDDDSMDVLSSKNVERITLLGERNTKISDIASHLVQCFPEIEVTTSFSRLGHWFQDPILEFSKNPTLVVAAFLNIYDWVDLMRQNPLHAPNHENMDWRTFVTTPWTMKRPKADLRFDMNDKKLCQWGFNYSEVIPCLLSSKSQKDPVYELRRDGSGKFFENILRLRAQKIRNFITTKHYENVNSFFTVKYEDLLQNDGFKRFVERIVSETGIPSQCNLSKISLPMPMDPKNVYDKNYIDWINDNADWIAEKKIKYKMDEMIIFSEPNDPSNAVNKTKINESSSRSNKPSSLLIEPKVIEIQSNPPSLSLTSSPTSISLDKESKPNLEYQAKNISIVPISSIESTRLHRNVGPPFRYNKGPSTTASLSPITTSINLDKDVKPNLKYQAKKMSMVPKTSIKSTRLHRNIGPPFRYIKGPSTTASLSPITTSINLDKDVKPNLKYQAKKMSMVPKTSIKSNRLHRNVGPPFSYIKGSSTTAFKKQMP